MRAAQAWRQWDRALFAQVAGRHWPGAEPVLPRLSRAANHGRLWLAAAGTMAALGGREGRRAAVRGLGSLAVASLAVNTVGKGAVGRARPLLDAVPVIRRLHRQPLTSSFPSGHAASAAAFTAGAAMESPAWGTVLAPVAASVAFSRVYTGVHYPGDVLAGCALGAGAALVVRTLRPPARPRPQSGHAVPVPALAGGRGLHVVVNTASGPPPLLTPAADRVRAALPEAVVIERTEDDDLLDLLETAAGAAAAAGGALGVCGGDGTVAQAAGAALRHGLPLAVFPGGSRNHFALDLGLETVEATAAAVLAGSGARVDVARRTDPSGRSPFLNTFSIGSYPDLVRVRERWSRRVGSWPASVLAAVHVLRTCEPVDVEVNGRARSVWLLFAGNCRYSSWGLAPVRRRDLTDGLLDVRIVDGGRFARTRLVAAALTGVLTSSPIYTEATVRRLRIRVPDVGGAGGAGAAHGTGTSGGAGASGRAGSTGGGAVAAALAVVATAAGPGVRLACDGEVAPAPAELLLDKVPGGLRVYRA